MRKHHIMIRLIGIMLFSLMIALFSRMEVKAWDYSGGKVSYVDVGKTENNYPTIAIGDWEFQIKANEAVVIGYIGDNTGTVYVPDTVPYKGGEAYGVKYAAGDYPVHAIGTSALSPNNSRKVIAEGTTHNGGKIERVVLPATVDTIGAYAFNQNSSLKKISFSGSSELELIGDYAFNGCTELESLILPSSVEGIGYSCFSDCTKLSNINIPSKISVIPSYCFKECTSLRKMELHSGITSIGSNAFESSGIATINLPDSITSIGDNAFYYCGNLQSIHIPKGLSTINYRAFAWCTSLKSISIPKTVITINREAFSYDRGVTSITLAEGVTSIRSKAFFDIPETRTIKIPYSVTSMDSKSIGYYESEAGERTIPGFKINGYNDTKAQAYAKENDISFNGTNKIGFKFTYSNVNYVTTGRKTVSVAAVTNKNVSSLTIPDTVSNGAVTYKVTKIKDKAYSGCKSLREVKIGANVTEIGKNAFKNCTALETVTIGKRVTNIGNQAFYNCKNLKNMTIMSKKISKIGTNAYKKTYKNMAVKVPKSKIKDYKKKLVKSGAAKTITVEKN